MTAPARSALSDVIRPDGTIETGLLSARLRVSKLELAAAAGLSRDAVSKSARLNAPATQARLRDMVEIITRVLLRHFGSLLSAFSGDLGELAFRLFCGLLLFHASIMPQFRELVGG